ncbi:AMP-binding enzyme [Phytophthora infestans]|uniref:acetate--CoA ligase n=1 Tax=Phytophthora infestans TaxID=4787 RepID=A0A833SWU7_PHYIN|nr:AMP-binding enzyme [Phytophthora infestans]
MKQRETPSSMYMPMIPETVFVMLACTQIGAVHNMIFAAVSVFTSDEGRRGGRILPLKSTVDTAIQSLDFVRNVCVFKRTHNTVVQMNPQVDVDMEEDMSHHRLYGPAEYFHWGAQGNRPHIGGYLMVTAKYAFDIHDDDIFACDADCGWITGHTYVVYGPLANGITTVLFESTPSYPHHGRYRDLIQRHKVTQFYTAPTAI